jgi:hypothetical protein
MEVKMCKLKEYDKDKFVADIKYDYILKKTSEVIGNWLDAV